MFTKTLVHLALALAAITQFASAAPHTRIARRHQQEHAAARPPRIFVTERVAKTVYVNQAGETIEPKTGEPICVTVTEGAKPTNPPPPSDLPAPPVSTRSPAPPAPKPAPAPAPKPEPKPAPKPEPKPPVVEKPEPKPSPKPSPKPAPTPKPDAPAPGSKPGIAYSPYHPDPVNGGRKCKEELEMKADIQKLAEFNPIRIYSTDCHQIDAILKYGDQQIFVGLDNAVDPSNELNDLLRDVGANGNAWDRIHTVAVGNEVLQFEKCSVEQWVSSINSVRGQLRAKGYSGPVVGVDTFGKMIAPENRQICDASDYVAVNGHCFFDPRCNASGIGQWLEDMKRVIGDKLQGCAAADKNIMFTEVGWPKAGNKRPAPPDVADDTPFQPTVANQQAAFMDIKIHSTLGSNYIAFTGFDDKWKSDTPATFGTEQHWGIADLSSF